MSDYRRHGLRAAPRLSLAARVNDSCILAAVATGLIASVIIANNQALLPPGLSTRAFQTW